jgi:ABC-type dipeptide/oligopeptide/nickel transport system permease subunit
MGTLSIAGAIRMEASLSFLGFGVTPPDPSWGNLIREGVDNILQSPWVALFPGLALTFSVLAFNMVGDSLRDMFDPRAILGKKEGLNVMASYDLLIKWRTWWTRPTGWRGA